MAIQYGTSTAITITAASLAAATARSSAAVTAPTTNNSSHFLLTVNVLTTAVAPTGNKQVLVYGYASEDGTNYLGDSGTVDNVDGTDKTLAALGSPTLLKFIGAMPLAQGAVAVTARGVFNITDGIGGLFPKWGIVLYNDAGTALGATITASYREVYYT